MNILHFTYSLNAGGRRNAIVNLSNGTARRGVNNYACSLSPISENDILELNKTSLIEISSLESCKHYLQQNKKLFSKLDDICSRYEIDLIHSHDAASQIIAALLIAKVNKHPHLYTFHRSLPTDTKGIKNKVRNFYANRYTDIITVGSNDRKNHYLSNNLFFDKDKIRKIPFGIDLERYKHSKENREKIRFQENFKDSDIVLGCIGHFGKEKGIDIILNAFSILKSKPGTDHLKLVVAGQGSNNETSFIRKLASELRLDESVIFTGFHNDIHKWYSCFDLFIHAARMEAFGLVLIEAMAAELPIVASRTGGMNDIVDDSKSGYLVDPENPASLAEAIITLANNKELLNNFAEYGYAKAKSEYSIQIFAKRYHELYESLLN